MSLFSWLRRKRDFHIPDSTLDKEGPDGWLLAVINGQHVQIRSYLHDVLTASIVGTILISNLRCGDRILDILLKAVQELECTAENVELATAILELLYTANYEMDAVKTIMKRWEDAAPGPTVRVEVLT